MRHSRSRTYESLRSALAPDVSDTLNLLCAGENSGTSLSSRARGGEWLGRGRRSSWEFRHVPVLPLAPFESYSFTVPSISTSLILARMLVEKAEPDVC